MNFEIIALSYFFLKENISLCLKEIEELGGKGTCTLIRLYLTQLKCAHTIHGLRVSLEQNMNPDKSVNYSEYFC